MRVRELAVGAAEQRREARELALLQHRIEERAIDAVERQQEDTRLIG